jgi:outer membrane protein assembly factor BamB
VAFEHAGETLITVLNNDGLLVVRAKDGSLVAEHAWETDYVTTAATPIVFEDKIFISSGYGRGCALLQLKDGKLDLVYSNRNMCNHMNNCVLFEGHLYGFDGNSHNPRTVQLTCMDFGTGKVDWKRRGLGCGSLLLSNGKLLLLSDEGELVIATAQPNKYEDIAHAQVIEGRCWTVPVLSHGRLYCRNADGAVVCVDLGP